MPNKSVQDFIRAAEALQGNKNEQDVTPTIRRGHKLSLKTDEHIKEEFLRKGDGSWSKNVDIGKQQRFVPGPPVPFIKVTSETPLTTRPMQQLPRKLPRSIPGAFESISETPETGTSSPDLVELAPSERTDAPFQTGNRDVATAKSVDPTTYQAESRKLKSSKTHQQPTVEDHNSADDHAFEDDLNPRERIIFDPVKWSKRHESREKRTMERSRERTHVSNGKPRRKKYHQEQSDSLDVENVETKMKNGARSRSTASRPVLHGHEDVTEEYHEQRRRKHSSRSRSRHEHEIGVPSSPSANARRSSHSLWPSFSQSERRNTSGMLEAASIRHRSTSRTRSDAGASATATRTDFSPKTLEFAEYVAGAKFDNVPSSPPLRPPPSPMGYVRSRSSTGKYSEGFTREKRLLRKPSNDEIVEHLNRDRGRKERQPSWHRVQDERISEPWQVKLLQGIARM